MSKTTGSIAEAYETYLVPLQFEQFARDITARAATSGPSTILETACGTGLVTEMLRDILPRNGHLVATDLNQTMLDVAAPKFADDQNVKLEVMDATHLTLPSNTFDVVVCQFGWMFFPDKVVAAREAWRVLKPDGRLVFSVWCEIDVNPAPRIARETIKPFFKTDPPKFYETPFSCADKDKMHFMLSESGFQDIDIDTVSFVSEVPSAHDAATGLVCGNPVVNSIVERGINVPDVVDAVATALKRELGDNPMRTPLKALVITARRAGQSRPVDA
jgi:ubiquinone/menaquinone biosynthesis C-methylase UbiE